MFVACGICNLWPKSDERTSTPRSAPVSAPAPARQHTTVSACLTIWEYIEYVAEGYEIDGLAPDDAMDTAIVMVSGVYGMSLDDLDDCLVILKAAGY